MLSGVLQDNSWLQVLLLRTVCCIAAQVWFLRVDIHVLDADGNLADAAVLSALAALLSFRRPDVTVGGADGR